jgi:hypothetical protein
MAKLSEVIQYQTTTGLPRLHKDIVVTPVSRSLTVRLSRWGFVWNRPVAVLVEDGESTTELAIVDVTLLVQIGVFAAGLAATLIGFMVTSARKR